MIKKCLGAIVGSWYLFLTYFGFFLIHVGLCSPAPDPFVMPWEEIE